MHAHAQTNTNLSSLRGEKSKLLRKDEEDLEVQRLFAEIEVGEDHADASHGSHC